MAEKAWTETRLATGEVLYTWGPVALGDTCKPVMLPASHNDRSVQVSGTPGAGFSLDIKGSNESSNPGSTFQSLREPGNAKLVTLLVTANLPDIRQILESTMQIQPVPSGGDGTTAVTIRLKCSSQARR